MTSFRYNDMDFTVEPATGQGAGARWDIFRKTPQGAAVCVAAGLFAGLAQDAAESRARALVRSIFPVGIKLIGPDTTHPSWVGDLKIIGPDVGHPNFIYWEKDTASFPA